MYHNGGTVHRSVLHSDKYLEQGNHQRGDATSNNICKCLSQIIITYNILTVLDAVQ